MSIARVPENVRPDSLRCTKCLVWGGDDDFPTDKRNPGRRNRSSWCRVCMRARKRSDYRTPERIAAKKRRDREYYERNRGVIRDAQKNLRLKLRYGISEQDYNEMAEAQDHACLICGAEEKLVVDHCHDTLEVRGLLCSRCNLRLGHIEDTEWLQKALSYLGVSV